MNRIYLTFIGIGLFILTVLVIYDKYLPLNLPKNKLESNAIESVNLKIEKERYPTLISDNKIINLGAESAMSVLYNVKTGKEETLYEKNSSSPKPIASITKIVTALVGIENGTPEKILYPLLIESNNDVANYIADMSGREKFISKMNDTALKAGANDTLFRNPSGLDNGGGNLSSAKDLIRITEFILNKPKNIFNITLLPEYEYVELNGSTTLIKNTDLLLLDKSIPFKIIGGKTGKTVLAKEALLLINKSPIEDNLIINVVLRSDDRFGEMKKLLTWLADSYNWGKDLKDNIGT